MINPYFPSILVPIVGIFLPAVAMALLFIYIEKESSE
jgi:photosystem I reaction center subunit VIII